MYKGDEAKYGAIHDWVRQRKPKPEKCERCNKKKRLEIANISGNYTREIEDYKYLCRKCHMAIDGRTERNRLYKKQLKRKNIKCQYCSKSFHPKKQSSKFCCLPCYHKWNKGENHWHYKKGGDANVR